MKNLEEFFPKIVASFVIILFIFVVLEAVDKKLKIGPQYQSTGIITKKIAKNTDGYLKNRIIINDNKVSYTIYVDQFTFDALKINEKIYYNFHFSLITKRRIIIDESIYSDF